MIVISAWTLAGLCGVIGFEAGVIYALIFKLKP
jgi:hypothetical protein